jgi:hypothetical protein
VPLQPPEAVHDVALVEVQVSVEDPPLATAVGLAISVAVGTGLTVTVTLAAGLVPPAPLQVREYVLSAVNASVFWLPLLAMGPDQPPDALQAVALVELQVRSAAPPLLMVEGDAARDAEGG